MAFVTKIFCPACRYCTTATVGNGERILCLCRNCREVVNPNAVPFRFDPPLCPHCAKPVTLDEQWPESCPKCDTKLDYENGMHFSLFDVDRYPALGARVHVAREHPAERRRSAVPGLHLRKGDVVVFDVPDELTEWKCDTPTPVLEAEVVGIDQHVDGHLTRVYLNFVRPWVRG